MNSKDLQLSLRSRRPDPLNLRAKALFSLPVSTKAIYVSDEHRVQRGLGWLTIMHSVLQPVFTECFYLPGTALGPGETSVNKTQSLLTVLKA